VLAVIRRRAPRAARGSAAAGAAGPDQADGPVGERTAARA
jgi:hypothetical protein